MSSTSSSESESDEFWQYEPGYNRNYRNAYGHNPFYPSMGHPLIYYAQVPQPITLKPRGRKRKREGPNYFVKAFRWYSGLDQHPPNKNVPSNNPDLNGFAAWLDSKYDQYLQERTPDSDMFRVEPKQTSAFEEEKARKNANFEPSDTQHKLKRFLSVRSPWRKKRRSKSDEPIQKSNQSFQYILQPKDMSRPPSEVCQPCSTVTATSDCAKNTNCVKSRSISNITIVKNEEPAQTLPVHKEIQGKVCNQDFECQYCERKPSKVDAGTQYYIKKTATASESIDKCCCQTPEKKPSTSINQVPTSNVDIPNQPKSIHFECHCQSLDRMTRKPISRVPQENTPMDVQVKLEPKKQNHSSCQYPEVKVENVNAQTQYEDTRPAKTFCNNCCECNLREYVRNYPSPPPVQSTSKVQQCFCGRNLKDECVTEEMVAAVKLSQKSAQTSNHSIRLENEPAHEYPLFMKIVCADKLREEN